MEGSKINSQIKKPHLKMIPIKDKYKAKQSFNYPVSTGTAMFLRWGVGIILKTF